MCAMGWPGQYEIALSAMDRRHRIEHRSIADQTNSTNANIFEHLFIFFLR
ncbi:hypothetical protein HWC14_gp54 [Serratia phage Parlo]|uniref:Uncharacterized protein n=1 Tax=Serratia phage Parlo TaxID=2557554 RepID=A0A482MGE2_9CAUD|nr:hypothetical protein HWC14_gp54 [Serratia phage Parlo]QBQ72203.1 hypothetical protein CPT_Parlo_054 [Serratia phage Parlo]